MKAYDTTVNGGISTLGTGKTEVSQFKENETKVQSDHLLTYTNSFDNGNHNLTATAGFTTYYNSLSRLDGARKQGVGLVIPGSTMLSAKQTIDIHNVIWLSTRDILMS